MGEPKAKPESPSVEALAAGTTAKAASARPAAPTTAATAATASSHRILCRIIAGSPRHRPGLARRGTAREAGLSWNDRGVATVLIDGIIPFIGPGTTKAP